MIIEGLLLAGAIGTGYSVLTKEKRTKARFTKTINDKWCVLMDSLGTKVENGIMQEYEILDCIERRYGADILISIPFGKSYKDLRSLLPSIEHVFGCDCMINLAPNKKCGFLRLHFIGAEISVKDKLKFDWFKTFYGIKNTQNEFGESVSIQKMEEIISPYEEVVGFKIISKVPLGVSYKNIIDNYDVIVRTLGKCYFNFDSGKMLMETSIIKVPFDNGVRFKPIKTKPWELYVGMGYDWKPIILDYSQVSNLLDGGMINTGKTMAIIGAFINMCYWNKNVKLFVSNFGEKNDLAVFKDFSQTIGFANSYAQLRCMLEYLIKEMKRRNKVFADQKEPCFNVYQYNKRVKKEENKMEIWHFIADEVADLMEDNDIQSMVNSLARKSRNCGIYVTVGTQRGSLANLSSETKGQLANKMCFSQPNTASALTIMGGSDKTTDMVMALEKKREFVVDYIGGIKTAKTLYLDEDMVAQYVKELSEKGHKTIDFSGKTDQKTSKSFKNVGKNTKNKAKGAQNE